MGLMDRDYMHRTPEERTKSLEDAKKHRERLNEMGRLFAKGEAMTAKDKARLEQIYEENRAYLSVLPCLLLPRIQKIINLLIGRNKNLLWYLY